MKPEQIKNLYNSIAKSLGWNLINASDVIAYKRQYLL